MARNNYPQAGLDNMEPAAVQQIVASLRELHELGRPKTDEEVAKRMIILIFARDQALDREWNLFVWHCISAEQHFSDGIMVRIAVHTDKN